MILLLAVGVIALGVSLTIAPASAIGYTGKTASPAAVRASNSAEVKLSSEECVPEVQNLIAGQTNDVGSITIWNDADNLYVKYELDTGCTFGTLHLWVGNDLDNIPVSGGPNPNPVPGQFPYHFDATGSTSHTFTIPLAPLLVDQTDFCGTNLFVVAHAEVTCDGEKETAFGGHFPVNFDSPGRWYFYEDYTICCDETNEPPEVTCETAFGKGGWVFTTDKKSNPENLSSLKLTKNRWGWAINVTADGETTYDLWAGAGLNKTANGTLVGTVTVTKAGDQVTVAYNITSGSMSELHVYASDCKPTTLAPGQYGYTRYFDPGATSHTAEFIIVNDSTCPGDGIWIIAHAVVCSPATE